MSELSVTTAAEYLHKINPWWDGPSIEPNTQNLRPRGFFEPIFTRLTDLSKPQAVVLLGMRRVGKTFLARHMIAKLLETVPAKQVVYVELDHTVFSEYDLTELVKLIDHVTPDATGPRYLFLDEIQHSSRWETHLKHLADHRKDLRIMVTGSTATSIKKKSIETGTARFIDILLPPLTFYEFINLQEIEATPIQEIEPNVYQLNDISLLNQYFVEYIRYGGFPELAFDQKYRDDTDFKADLIGKTLVRELPPIHGITDTNLLYTFYKRLVNNPAYEVSPDQLAKSAGMPKNQIYKFLDYFEAAYLLKRAYRVDQDGRRFIRQRNFKAYLTNPSIYYCINGTLQEHDNVQFGHLVENALLAQRFREHENTHYARWGKSHREIDLVEAEGFEPSLAMEIKWSDKFERKTDLRALLEFAKIHTLPHVWFTTKTVLQDDVVDGIKIFRRPTALVAYHYGAKAVRRQPVDLDFQLVKA